MNKKSFTIKDIKLKSINAALTKLSCDNLDKRTFKINRKISVEVEDIKEKSFVINISEEINTIPKKYFVINLNVVGYFTSSKSVTKEKLEQDKIALSDPLFSFISLIVGFVTEKMLNSLPLILPPFYPDDDDEEEEESEDEDK